MTHFHVSPFVQGSTADFVPSGDTLSHGAVVVDFEHHEIHEGDAFLVIYSALKSNAETIEIRVATPNTTKWAHMVFEIQGALAGTAQIWEDTTKTHAAGNAITPVNRNRNSAATSGLTVCHTPAGAEAGAAMFTHYFGASSQSGLVSEGGGAGGRHEFILKQNTAYLIRATSRADGNALTIILDWYEHTSY